MKDAMITSYTHEPLVGMTSQTDPTGWVTYYIYDSFGRLQYIRNQEGYYIDKYEYHYGEDEQTEKNDSK
jgi:YD repeat-containing protein